MPLKISKEGTGSSSRSIKIFSFGNSGVGKSTLLASMIDYFRKAENALLVYNQNNVAGTKAMMDWLYRLKESQFPDISRRGEIVEIDIGIIGINDEIKYSFKLYEMSGEDLKRIDIQHGGKLEKDFLNALENSDVILALAPRNEARKHEMLIAQFFNYLYSRRFKIPVCIIITKWDIFSLDMDDKISMKSNDIILKEIIENELSWPYKFLKVNGIFDDPMAFYFSIGKVVEVSNNDEDNKKISKIKDYVPFGIEEISEWVLNVTLTKSTK